jgi:hypothetical protein
MDDLELNGCADSPDPVLGHAIVGIEGVYNRHAYLDEKSDALQRLANLVETVLNPPAKSNVVEFVAARR